MSEKWKDPYDRFVTKLSYLPNGCIEWTANVNKKGYGRFYDGQKMVLAHRWSYGFFYGPLDESMLVCHCCDNPRCVNPDHLFLGTHADNVLDKVAKGRQARSKMLSERMRKVASRGGNHYSRRCPEKLARGDGHGSRIHPDSVHRGDGHYLSKLTQENVETARLEYQSGGTSYRKLAVKYGVSHATIYSAIKGKTWKS